MQRYIIFYCSENVILLLLRFFALPITITKKHLNPEKGVSTFLSQPVTVRFFDEVKGRKVKLKNRKAMCGEYSTKTRRFFINLQYCVLNHLPSFWFLIFGELFCLLNIVQSLSLQLVLPKLIHNPKFLQLTILLFGHRML